ncbi:MAG: FAD binding domain-containing protein [Gemmobacter sp.]
MSAFHRPATMAEALGHLAGDGMRILAGGTDLYPATTGPDLGGPILDITGLPGLRGIARVAGGLRVGACTSWAEIARAPLPPALGALAQAAREVGGRQIQTAGTLGGNLCNASPAADGVPPLLVCDAEVELIGPQGARRMPLCDFLQGPRRTARLPGEILAAVILPDSGLTGSSRFLKLGARAYLVISITMVAVRLDIRDGRVLHAALAVGAASPVARRLPAVEAALTGAQAAGAASRIDASVVAAALSPLDDARASAAYRAHAACALLRRAVEEIAGEAT